jgi:hypothetical protein
VTLEPRATYRLDCVRVRRQLGSQLRISITKRLTKKKLPDAPFNRPISAYGRGGSSFRASEHSERGDFATAIRHWPQLSGLGRHPGPISGRQRGHFDGIRLRRQLDSQRTLAPSAHGYTHRSYGEYEMRIGRTLPNYGLRCMRRTRLWKRESERMLSYAGSALRYSQTSRCSTARSSQRSAASLSPRVA